MKYKLANDPTFKPVPYVRVITHNQRTFSLGTLSTAHCLKLMQRMKTGAPDLYNTIHTDTFVKALVMDFDADILIPMKKR